MPTGNARGSTWPRRLPATHPQAPGSTYTGDTGRLPIVVHPHARGEHILLVDGGGDPIVSPAGSCVIRVRCQQPVQAIGYATGGAGDVWDDLLSSSLTAEQSVVAIHTMLSELHLIHGLTAGSPLSVTAASRAAGAVSQAVAEAAGTVTVTRK